jgi:hypothetical protein
MATHPLDANGQARTALRSIAQDYGPPALSNPEFLNSLLRDMIPDSPREASVLVAAAEANVAGILQERTAQRISTDAAVAQAVAALEDRTALAQDACQWAVRQLAEALGLLNQAGTTTPDPRSYAGPTLAPGTAPGPPTAPGPTIPPAPIFAPPGPTSWPAPPAPTARPGPTPAPTPGPVAVPQQPRERTRAATTAAVLGVVCALSVSLQVLARGRLGAAYSWAIAVEALTLFGAAVLTFGRSKYAGAGMIFGAALVMLSFFLVTASYGSGSGGPFVAATVVTTVMAAAAAVSAAVYFIPEARQGRANLRRPLVVAFCVAAIGYVVAFIPGDWQYYLGGSTWFTITGLLGPGVHKWFILAGVVALIALAIPIVTIERLAPGTGVRAGMVAGWLLVAGAAQLDNTIYIGQQGVRAAPAFAVTWVFWGLTAALGVALIASDRKLRVSSAQTPSALPTQ